jgi:hypothetical protein
VIRRKTNRRHMIGDPHGRTAGRATLLLKAADAILGRHRSRIAAWAAIPAAFADCQLASLFLELLRHHQASG